MDIRIRYNGSASGSDSFLRLEDLTRDINDLTKGPVRVEVIRLYLLIEQLYQRVAETQPHVRRIALTFPTPTDTP